MSIEAWVTGPSGETDYRAHLDRSEASPFRNFAVSRMRGADPGTGSLEHHLDNALTADGTLLSDGSLVWMRYRGRTLVWVIEERSAALDENEHATDWVRVTGRGVKQLLGDRTVWPTEFDETHLDPSKWGLGGYSSILDADAVANQAVVPVTSTAGAAVGIPVQVTGRPIGAGAAGRHVGVIQSIDAGISVTLENSLPVSFRKGSRILGATQQWRRFVNRSCGELLWDLIDESNPRFDTQIVRGTVEADFGWTQDFRFDNLLDIVKAVTDSYGDIDMDGLTFSYHAAPGVDRSAFVIFEEGADVLKVERATSDRNTMNWIVAEGVGEGSMATLAVSEAATINRRREGYLDAKDAGNLPLVQLRADAAIDELAPVDSIALEVTAERFAPFTDYDLHDTIRVIAPSRGIDETAVIVALYLAEDEARGVRVGIDVNTPRQEALLVLEEGNRSTASSVGVRNRMPQGQIAPFSFSGADVFDDTDTMDVLVYVPDDMYVCTKAKAFIRFRQFFASAKSASSGGGSTSGASQSGVNVSTEQHVHDVTGNSGAASAGTAHTHPDGTYSAALTSLPDAAVISLDDHTHSVSAHSHDLVYGVVKETMPASHSVTLKIYYWDDDSAWDLVTTISGITADTYDGDLTAYITGPGIWRLELKSAAAQPNGGRLGCDVSGFVEGAIQSA